jgi:renal tumor antigen
MLAARPLFPGKHQLDQLNQIHSVLGTPSRDMLAHFQTGQENSKVGFAFPQREKQSFRNLVPNATDLIVNLMEKMIVYDPIDRVTAHDALEHSVFRELRRADVEWQHSSRAVPFSAFFLNRASAAPEPAAVRDEPPRSLLAIRAKPGGASELRGLVPARPPENHVRPLLCQPARTFGRVAKAGPAGLFQRPKPDMVQPRLPPISFRPLRKPD